MKKQKSMTRRFKREDIPLYIMALPGVALLILFSYLPMGGLVLAFKKYNVQKGIFGSPFNGFDNFKILFSSSDAFLITRNTVLYNVVFIFVNMILAVIISLMLSELHSKRAAKLYQTVYMLPNFLSWAVVAIILSAFLERTNGYVNHILRQLGQPGMVDWYQKVSLWPPLLVCINAWKGVGYQAVMYLALIMAMGNIFRGDFGLFYTVTQDSGMLYPVTNVIDTYIYRGLMNQVNVGMTAATGLFQSLVGLVFVLLSNGIVSKMDPDSAMF